MRITFEATDQPKVHALLQELDAYLYSLFPPAKACMTRCPSSCKNYLSNK
jgi:hypothetical protein